MVIILNVCLIVGTVPIFMYMNTLTEVIRERFLDFILVGGGLVTIPMLYKMGVSYIKYNKILDYKGLGFPGSLEGPT